MNFLRIKQAQHALADGRLDEAHGLLNRDEVRSHRQGQRLATKLVKAYVKRGEGHLAAGRLHEALADCDKASTLGGHDPAVAELRQRASDQMRDKRDVTAKKQQALGAARRHADAGFLSRGIEMLQGLNGDSARVAQAEQEIELQRTKAEAALERGEAALKREDWAAAGHHLAEARRLRPYEPRVEALAGRMTDQAAGCVREALQAGRIDKAQSLMRAVAPAAGNDLAIGELRETLGYVVAASDALTYGDARLAVRELKKVKTLLPKAKWIDAAISQAEGIVKNRELLAGGPLGLTSDGYASAARAVPVMHPSGQEVPSPTQPIAYHGGMDRSPDYGSKGMLPEQFLVQVDGCGAAYVTSSQTVTVGPVSSPNRPDVGLVADPGAPTVTLRREEDDYFLHCERDVKVNGKPIRQCLLNNGDKIELGPRCLVKFRIPHASSTTAILDLSGARMVRGDVKRVVLMDKQLVIGAGPACQVRADAAEEPIILTASHGALVCRSKQPVTAGGEACDASQGVPMESPVCIGPVTFRITQA